MSVATKVVRVDSTGYWKQASWSETWADIWLTWKDRRKPRHVCLTVRARADVENEIASYEYALKSDSFDDDFRSIFGTDPEDVRQQFQTDLDLSKMLFETLAKTEIHFDSEDHSNIWVADEFLDRRSIEKAIRAYFSKFGSVRPIRIKWKKPVGIVHGW
jgi:hypothetical protein